MKERVAGGGFGFEKCRWLGGSRRHVPQTTDGWKGGTKSEQPESRGRCELQKRRVAGRGGGGGGWWLRLTGRHEPPRQWSGGGGGGRRVGVWTWNSGG